MLVCNQLTYTACGCRDSAAGSAAPGGPLAKAKAFPLRGRLAGSPAVCDNFTVFFFVFRHPFFQILFNLLVGGTALRFGNIAKLSEEQTVHPQGVTQKLIVHSRCPLTAV